MNRKRRRLLNNLLDLHQLKYRCGQTVKRAMIDLEGEVIGKFGEQYAFKDNGSNVLAVAHLDTVQKSSHFAVTRLEDETIVFNPKLDDRLGVYTILDLLPKLGVVCDILLTENEEVGASTAKDFVSGKQYNWIFSFDRNGCDAVTYDYDWKLVNDYFEDGMGSFSDISELQHLKCKAVNVGTAYYLEHTSRCYCVIEEYLTQVMRFVEFWREQHEVHYEHEPVEPFGSLWLLGDEAEEDDSTWWWCENCNDYYFDEQVTEGTVGQPECPHCHNIVIKGNLREEIKKSWWR